MTIKLGEIGRQIYIGTSFDLSGFSELTIRFSSPTGAIEVVKTTADGVTAPSVDSPPLPDIGILPANTYMLYTTQANDFNEGGAGNWTVCVIYNDLSPKEYYGNDSIFPIEEGC